MTLIVPGPCRSDDSDLAPGGDLAEARNNLGILLARQGRLEAAIGHFREALRIRPDNPEAQRNLDAALGERPTGR